MKNLRWAIAGLICLGMAVNYLDRQVLSVLAPEIRDEFHLTNTDYALIVFAFQLSYMVSSGAGGRFADYIGVRASYAAMMAFWSASSLLHSLATGARSFIAYRFMLGMGEGGAFPTGVKALTEWFPRKERALALGISNASLAAGGILAPPLTVFFALRFGWRVAFLLTGALGFVWIAVWLPMYRHPTKHSWATRAELDWIQSDTVRESATPAPVHARELLRFPQIWGLLLARFMSDAPWQFYMFWLPEYLARVRGMRLAEIGMVAWTPFLFAGIGGIVGGMGSDRIIRTGRDPVLARKTVMVVSAALLPAGILAASAATGIRAVAYIWLVAMGHYAWVTNAQILPADVLPPRIVATAVGLSQTAGYLGSLVATLLIGYVLDHFSYFPVFCAAGVMHPLATIILLWTFVRTGRLTEHFAA
jgi:ACS family hexuronate transporter-like MFS transporter